MQPGGELSGRYKRVRLSWLSRRQPFGSLKDFGRVWVIGYVYLHASQLHQTPNAIEIRLCSLYTTEIQTNAAEH